MTDIWPSVRLIGLTFPVHDEGFDKPLEMDSVNWPGMPGEPELDAGLQIVELAGRWDYGPRSIAHFREEPKPGQKPIIQRWLESGEESMIEMVDAIFLVTCSRVVTHELVRHRLASYQQESQRFVKYDEEDPDDLFYLPPDIADADDEVRDRIYRRTMQVAFEAYQDLRKAGVSPQIARYVLPNATRTRIVVKMNLRSWRHVLQLRLHTSAQPEMRSVMGLIHQKLREIYGEVLFPTDIAHERATR